MIEYSDLRDWLTPLITDMTRKVVNVRSDDKNRQRESWSAGTLPDQSGRRVKLGGEHIHLLTVLLMHGADLTSESTHTSVSLNKMGMYLAIGERKVSQLLKDLRDVGIITTQRRTNTSSKTTIHRRPGCWGKLGKDEESTGDNIGDDPSQVADEVSCDEHPDWVRQVREAVEGLDEDNPFDKCYVQEGSDPWGESYRMPSMAKAKELERRTKNLLGDDYMIVTGHKSDGLYVVVYRSVPRIASLCLSEIYKKECKVDRIPGLKENNQYQAFKTLSHVFDGAFLQKYLPMFGSKVRNPEGLLVSLWKQMSDEILPYEQACAGENLMDPTVSRYRLAVELHRLLLKYEKTCGIETIDHILDWKLILDPLHDEYGSEYLVELMDWGLLNSEHFDGFIRDGLDPVAYFVDRFEEFAAAYRILKEDQREVEDPIEVANEV